MGFSPSRFAVDGLKPILRPAKSVYSLCLTWPGPGHGTRRHTQRDQLSQTQTFPSAPCPIELTQTATSGHFCHVIATEWGSALEIDLGIPCVGSSAANRVAEP